MRLLLVGRTPLPNKSTWETELQHEDRVSTKIKAYQQLQQLPGSVIYEAVDICDLAQLQSVVSKTLFQWDGQLNGVIHLAGIFQEKLLVSETPESVATVLRSKVLGTWALHQLLKDYANAFFLHFSSVNGFFGGMAVGVYAAANSFIETFCDYQRGHSTLQSYCLAWSMWHETGMSQGYQMQEFSRAKGYFAITPSQGIYSLLAVLSYGQNRLLIGLDGTKPNVQYLTSAWQSLQHLTAYITTKTQELSVSRSPNLQVCDRYGTPSYCYWHQLAEMPLTESGEIAREQLVSIHASLANGEQTRPRNELESQLVEIFQELLSVSHLSIHDNFFALGGNSLRATQLVSRLQQILNLEVPVRTLFESPTVAKLAIASKASAKIAVCF